MGRFTLTICLVLALTNCKKNAVSPTKSFVDADDEILLERFIYELKPDNVNFTAIKNLARSIAMVGVKDLKQSAGFQQELFYSRSTGFLISPKYVMTNHHGLVQNLAMDHDGHFAFTENFCNSNRFQTILDFGHTRDKRPELGATRRLCKRIVFANQEYDVAIIELDKELRNVDGYDYVPLKLLAEDMRQHEWRPLAGVFLMGHPRGREKTITSFNRLDGKESEAFAILNRPCTIWSPNTPPEEIAPRDKEPSYLLKRYSHTMLHDCDTDHGSSGSPVFLKPTPTFNGDTPVIGLHWNGWKVSKYEFYTPESQGGHPMNPGTGEGTDKYPDMPIYPGNSMIRIDEIYNYINGMIKDLTADGFKASFVKEKPSSEPQGSDDDDNKDKEKEKDKDKDDDKDTEIPLYDDEFATRCREGTLTLDFIVQKCEARDLKCKDLDARYQNLLLDYPVCRIGKATLEEIRGLFILKQP
ncbi:MAG: serine protease [Oligoflexales bacterium]